MKEADFLEMLLQLSDAISKRDEKYVDMLRVLYRDLVNTKTELEEAKSAVDLFKRLIAPGILKPTDISVLFETVELTGLKYLKDIIEKYETYPDEVKITRFSPYRQQVVALGKDFSVKDLQKVRQLYERNFSSPWKVIQHLEDTCVLTETSMPSFHQRLNENKLNNDFNQLLVRISEAISMKGEKYVDMLRVLYKDLAQFKAELEKAKSAFDLFQILKVAGILKPTNISILFETIEITGLRCLKKIIETHDTYPDDVKITRFSAHRQHLVALGRDFTTLDIQRIAQIYNVPDDFCFNPWKLITFLESKGFVSEDKLSSFLKNCESVFTEESSTSKSQKLDKDIIIKDSLTSMQKEKYLDVNRMTPAIWNKHHKVDIKEVFTDLSLLKSQKQGGAQSKSTCVKREGESTSLTEVLATIKSTDSCKVLITGEGGMGKTTLLKYITYQWATDDNYIFADKVLFLINIREIKTGETFLNIIMNKIDFKAIILKNSLPCNSVESFLVTHDDKILILLDGYDELEKDAKDPIDLFKKSELQNSTVVITSRPDNTADLVECCDVHIEVKGFSPCKIKAYIHNHFQSIGKIKIGESLIKAFRLDLESYWWGGDHRKAFQLCSSPLLLLQICTIWEQKHVLPTYLTDLFKELICCILNQYLNRAGNKNAIANFDRIPGLCKSYILILGECMYEGLKVNKLSIDKYDLLEIAKDSKLVEKTLQLGFVYEDTPVNPGDIREMYTPPHKLISEALAGLYLSTEIQKERSKVESEEIRCNYYLNMTRVFTIGFLGANVDKLLQPWLNTPSNYGSIALCLKHVKEDLEDDILKKLDKHMSNDMKAYSMKMCESFRRLLNDDRYISSFNRFLCGESRNISSMYLLKLLRRLQCISYNVFTAMDIKTQLEKAAISVISSGDREMQCLIVIHTFWLIKVLREYEPGTPYLLLKYISTWKKEEINLLSAEMGKNNFKYTNDEITIAFKLNSAFLVHFLRYASGLISLYIYKDNTEFNSVVTGTVLNEVINDLFKANIKLKLLTLNIHGNDISDIDGMLLGKLFKIAPKLKDLNLINCRLSGDILSLMITDCKKNDVRNSLGLCYNDTMKNYNLHKLVESDNTLNWQWINLSNNNLSSINGITLACLVMISPDLNHINMSDCSLSGRIVTEMMEECGRMNIVLKDGMFNLKGNDLSCIDGKSLAKLVRVIHKPFDYINPFTWSDYSLTADNLKEMVESEGVNIIFNWKRIDLSKTNLSLISGKILVCLFKISPVLIHIDMSDCSLSGRIVIEMVEECCRMNVVLKDNMLRLKGNDLSDVDGKFLAKLIRVISFHDFKWSDYSLTADHLVKLVESVDENIIYIWQRIDFSKSNISSICGKTLACLFKISPDLIHIDMSDCSLSGRIVTEMMEECGRMNIVLKDNMFNLKGNDLSCIDGKSLAKLVWVINPFTWSDYSLTAGNLKEMVKSEGVNIIFNWKRIDWSKGMLRIVSIRSHFN